MPEMEAKCCNSYKEVNTTYGVCGLIKLGSLILMKGHPVIAKFVAI